MSQNGRKSPLRPRSMVTLSWPRSRIALLFPTLLQTFDEQSRNSSYVQIWYVKWIRRGRRIGYSRQLAQSLLITEHPAFAELIQMASRGPRDLIDIPSRHATRVEILEMFKEGMSRIREDLMACKGRVSLTDDAWSAGNGDGYLVVTAHWIHESTPQVWELRMAIIGFQRMMKSHSGKRLGQAVFKIARRVSCEKKV